MAATAIGIGDVSNALQKVIMPFIRDNYEENTLLLDQVKKNSGVTFANDYFYADIRTSRHGGVTNLATDKAKLVSGSATVGQARVQPKIPTGTFDISKMVLDATKSSKGAVENQLTFQARTLAEDFAKHINRQLLMDGSGIVSEVSSSANASVIPVAVPTSSNDDGRALDRYGVINGDVGAVKYLFPWNVIGIGTAAAAVATIAAAGVADGGTVGTITLSAGTAHAANDAIFLLDGDTTGAGSAEIEGLGKALTSATANYANLARSTFGWTPQYSTVSGALTLSDMEDKYLSATEYAQPEDMYAIFVNKTLYKKYGDLLTAMRRTVNKTELVAGWTGLEFTMGVGKNMNVAVFLDRNVPDGECIIVNLDSLTIAQVSDMDWMENPDGGALNRRDDYITYQATMHWFLNLICLAPAANAKLMRRTD